MLEPTARYRLLSSYTRSQWPISNTTTRNDIGAQEPWKAQKAALEAKFGDAGWQPRKRLSPDAMDGIRALHAQDPGFYSVPYLANQFEISPEAVRRILKSKWRPTPDEAVNRSERWERRGQSVWNRWAELGYKPPKKWREGLEQGNASTEGTVQPVKSKFRKGKAPSGALLSSRIL
jgi:Neugrin